MPVRAFAILLLLLPLRASTGLPPVHISRYLFGEYLTDPRHRVEVFNATAAPLDVSGYLLLTRQYAARFPAGTVIPPFQALSMAKSGPVSLPFTAFDDFSLRFAQEITQGDYVALLDRRNRMVDGFWISPRTPVFLPDVWQGISVPAANSRLWSGMSLDPRIPMAVIRLAGGWQMASDTKNLTPATEFGPFSATYRDGVVALSWQTQFEEECYAFEVERSANGGPFARLQTVRAAINARTPQRYLAYDTEAKPDQLYQYRIRQQDKFGFVLTSAAVPVSTRRQAGDVSLTVLPEEAGAAPSFSINALTATPVQVLLLDESYAVVGTLYRGELGAGDSRLIALRQGLPNGTYVVLAQFARHRILQAISV